MVHALLAFGLPVILVWYISHGSNRVLKPFTGEAIYRWSLMLCLMICVLNFI